jgi:hypothetical protein
MSLRMLALLTLLFVSSCSGESRPDPAWDVQGDHQFKVSVYSGGKEVKDFNTQLIHRVDISPEQLKRVFGADDRQLRLPFTGTGEKDRFGKIAGVRVGRFQSPEGGPQAFGLKNQDLITAIGVQRATSIDDFRRLGKELSTTKSSSITLEREGRPHKILYSLTLPGQTS